MKIVLRLVKVVALILCQGLIVSSPAQCMRLDQKLVQLRGKLDTLKTNLAGLRTKLGDLKKKLSGAPTGPVPTGGPPVPPGGPPIITLSPPLGTPAPAGTGGAPVSPDLAVQIKAGIPLKKANIAQELANYEPTAFFEFISRQSIPELKRIAKQQATDNLKLKSLKAIANPIDKNRQQIALLDKFKDIIANRQQIAWAKIKNNLQEFVANPSPQRDEILSTIIKRNLPAEIIDDALTLEALPQSIVTYVKNCTNQELLTLMTAVVNDAEQADIHGQLQDVIITEWTDRIEKKLSGAGTSYAAEIIEVCWTHDNNQKKPPQKLADMLQSLLEKIKQIVLSNATLCEAFDLSLTKFLTDNGQPQHPKLISSLQKIITKTQEIHAQSTKAKAEAERQRKEQEAQEIAAAENAIIEAQTKFETAEKEFEALLTKITSLKKEKQVAQTALDEANKTKNQSAKNIKQNEFTAATNALSEAERQRVSLKGARTKAEQELVQATAKHAQLISARENLKAQTSLASANAALTQATNSSDEANNAIAKAQASKLVVDASIAVTAADAALNDATSAVTLANTAKTDSETAQAKNVTITETAAKQAVADAITAVGNAEALKATADTNVNMAKAAQVAATQAAAQLQAQAKPEPMPQSQAQPQPQRQTRAQPLTPDQQKAALKKINETLTEKLGFAGDEKCLKTLKLNEQLIKYIKKNPELFKNLKSAIEDDNEKSLEWLEKIVEEQMPVNYIPVYTKK